MPPLVLKAFCQRLHQGDGFEDIEGIGAERSRSIVTWYQNEKNHSGFEDLLHELSIEHVEVQDTSSGSCAGLSFVITGDVHHYKNRDEFKAYVESQGGKVTGSVYKKRRHILSTMTWNPHHLRIVRQKNWEFRLFPKIHL